MHSHPTLLMIKIWYCCSCGFVYRPLLPLVTTTAMWVWGWSAPKRWPQPSVGPSSWPSCPLSQSGEVIGVTRSVNPTPCPARWLAAVALSWCVSFLPPVVLALCLPLCPRSCSWWPVLMTATPLPGAAPPPSATLVRFLGWLSGFLLALLSFTLQWCSCRYQER